MFGNIPESLLQGGFPEPLPDDPMPLLKQWYDEGLAKKATSNPDAMTLATVSPNGQPSARVVLCRRVEVSPPGLVFYTNYHSRKSIEMLATGKVAAVLHWDAAERQARVEGTIEQTTSEDSDAYFSRRHLMSRLGSWASAQSEPIGSRAEFVTKFNAVLARFKVTMPDAAANKSGVVIPRPPHWGGFRIRPASVELWSGAYGRLHDRAVWKRAGEGWTAQRLQP